MIFRKSHTKPTLIAAAFCAALPLQASAEGHAVGVVTGAVSELLSSNDYGNNNNGNTLGSGLSANAGVNVAGVGANVGLNVGVRSPRSSPQGTPASNPQGSQSPNPNGQPNQPRLAADPNAGSQPAVTLQPNGNLVRLTSGRSVPAERLLEQLVISRDGTILGVVSNAQLSNNGTIELLVNVNGALPVSASQTRLQLMVVRMENNGRIRVPLTARQFLSSMGS